MVSSVRIAKTFQRHVLNPVVKALVRRGRLRGWAILETRGRRSGGRRETPVGIRVDGATAWVVAEFGRRASYVKNIEADPRVRVCVKGMWREGTAAIVDDDPRAHLHGVNGLAVRAVGRDLLTIRIALER